MDLISVIVPVYKAEKYLPLCLDSLLAQTYQNLQIILVDDGSPDECPLICDRYASKDGRIQVLHQSNRGISAARNAGLEVAKGSYIGFVDSDDWVEPDMFEALVALSRKYDAPIAMCGYEINEERSLDPIVHEGVYQTYDALEHIIKAGLFNGYLWNKLFYASLFHNLRFDENILYCEDLLACVQCFMQVESISYSSRPYYHYRMSENSLTRRLTMGTLTSFQAREQIISYCLLRYPQLKKHITQTRYPTCCIGLIMKRISAQSIDY